MIGRTALALLVLSGCTPHQTSQRSRAEAGASPAAAPKPAAPPLRAPLSQAELPSTDGAIALSNLEAQIDSAEGRLGREPRQPEVRAGLITLLSARGQFTGHLADYDRCEREAARLVNDSPNSSNSYRIRAEVLATLHRFSDAAADLDRAEQLGEPKAHLLGARAALAEALGRTDEALALAREAVAARKDLSTLGALAAVKGVRGEIAEAERLFAEAQHHYRDVSPFPIAALYFQHGLMEERAGRPASARELYQAAVDRLPSYAPAIGHLAQLVADAGEVDRAAAMLRKLCARSDDPEYPAELAALLVHNAVSTEAWGLLKGARRRYRDLVRRHPEAFADHAARFWAGLGADPLYALTLAQANQARRPTRDAYRLVMEVALKAGQAGVACRAAGDALALPGATAALHLQAAQTFTACGDKQRADAELALAAAPTP